MGYATAETPGDASRVSALELTVLGVVGWAAACAFGGGAKMVYAVANGGTWRAVHVSAGASLVALCAGAAVWWWGREAVARAFAAGVAVAGATGLGAAVIG